MTDEPTVTKVQYEEDVALAWADIIRATADEHGAPNFAWHMSERGTAPSDVREMARLWRENEFEPHSWAAELDLFADAVQGLIPDDGERAWKR